MAKVIKKPHLFSVVVVLGEKVRINYELQVPPDLGL